MTRNLPTRGLYLEVPGDVMDALVKAAAEDGTSVTRLVEGWVMGRVRGYGKEG